MKCPNCGAPMSGTTCAYCGSTRTPETARGPERGTPVVPDGGKHEADRNHLS